jgi:hypothetical protein
MKTLFIVLIRLAVLFTLMTLYRLYYNFDGTTALFVIFWVLIDQMVNDGLKRLAGSNDPQQK